MCFTVAAMARWNCWKFHRATVYGLFALARSNSGRGEEPQTFGESEARRALFFLRESASETPCAPNYSFSHDFPF
jgi:hypothetical protein